MGLLLLLVSSFALLVSSTSLALLFRQNHHPARLLLAIVSGWLFLCYLTLLTCGLLHLLRSDVVTTLSLLVAIILTWATKNQWLTFLAPCLRVSPFLARPNSADATFFTDRVIRFLTLAVILFGLHWLRESITGPTQLADWDDLNYHLYYPTYWLINQRIQWPIPSQMLAWQGFFPFASELIGAWFALPFQNLPRGNGLAWASLTGCIYMLLVLSSMADIVRRMARSAWAWLLPAILFLSSVSFLKLSSSYADTDLALPASLLAALSFALPRSDSEQPIAAWQDGFYAACLLGLSGAIKMSAVISIPLITLLWLVRIQFSLTGTTEKQVPWIRRIQVFCMGCAMFLVLGMTLAGYWYLRNFWITGNPLFPALLWDLAGVNFKNTTLREFFIVHGDEVGWRETLQIYFNWSHLHGIVAAAGFVLQFLYLVLNKRELSRTRWITGSSVLILAAVLLAVLPKTPFSAGTVETFAMGRLHGMSYRYIALVPLLGWMTWGWLLDLGNQSTWQKDSALVLAILCILLRDTVPASLATAVVVVVTLWVLSLLTGYVATTSLGVLMQGVWKRAAGLIIFLGISCLVVASACHIVLYHHRKSSAVENYLAKDDTFGTLVNYLEKQPKGRQIAIYGFTFNYLLFGKDRQLEPIKLNIQGQRLKHWKEILNFSQDVSTESWREGIAESGIDMIVFLRDTPSPKQADVWPKPRARLQAWSGAKLAYEDEHVSIWEIMPRVPTSEDSTRD